MFRPLDWTTWDEYQSDWPIADSLNPSDSKHEIFGLNVLGFQTHRDHFAIASKKSEMEDRAKAMIDGTVSDAQFAERYSLKSNRDWKIPDARDAIRKNRDWRKNIVRCAYRPFDEPYCFFGHEFMDYPRRELLDHVAWRENIQLLASRQIGIAEWRHVLVTDRVAESCCVSDGSTEQNYCFPLYLYGRDGVNRRENMSSSFRSWLDHKYEEHFSAEEVMAYIYAVLYAPTYRTRYAEFLRIDFPRAPFPESSADFQALSELSWALMRAHLLTELPRQELGVYHGKGDHVVEALRYSSQEQTIWINKTQSFKPVPQTVGGYQVLDKYLKSRKGRTLSLDEINRVAAIVDSLAFTIQQMAKIDKAYVDAFPGRG